MNVLYEALNSNPVIAAVKDESLLEVAVASPCGVLFLLAGNICTIEERVARIHACGKQVYIHMDLMEGFGRDRHSLRYIHERIAPDGIITTKSNLVKAAKELGMFAIQRMFLIDNLSFDSGIQSLRQIRPDAVEVMPGIIPQVTKKICAAVSIPVITGGLINEKSDIISSLNAGAVGVSTSKLELWES